MALDFRRNAVSRMQTTFLTKAVIILAFLFVVFILAVFCIPERKAAAKDTPSGTYQIISVEVEAGDSLWNIANEYFSEEFHSIHEYISEIKRMNGMSSDTLYAGAYLLIPCYR